MSKSTSSLTSLVNQSAPVSASTPPFGLPAESSRDAPGPLNAQSTTGSALEPPSSGVLPDLPSLPQGFSLEDLAQLGGEGLQLAIRIGMGIGMSLRDGDERKPPLPPPPQPTSDQQTQSMSQTLDEQDGTGTQKGSPGRGATSSDTVIKNILEDDFFCARDLSTRATTPGLTGTTSRPLSRRPSSGALDAAALSPTGPLSPRDATTLPSPGPAANATATPSDQGAEKKDPLSAQVWKTYTKAKGGLPNGARMENLTWRMMHLKLKVADGSSSKPPVTASNAAEEVAAVEAAEEADQPGEMAGEEVERGRRGRFKGRGRVVGFDAASPQGHDE